MFAESLPGIGERCSLEQLRQSGHPLGVPLLPRHSVNLPLVPTSSDPARPSPEWPADPRAALLEPLWDCDGSEGKHVLPHFCLYTPWTAASNFDLVQAPYVANIGVARNLLGF